MNILDKILPARRDAEIVQWASILAERQRQRVWTRLEQRAGTLASLPEARGYVRSRALADLRDALDVMLLSTQLAPGLEIRILRRAQDLLASRYANAMVQPAPVLAEQKRAA